jgi:hypothetical protein
MKRNILSFLFLLLLTLSAKAQSIADQYWIVGDTNPGTQVFHTGSDNAFIANSNAGFLAALNRNTGIGGGQISSTADNGSGKCRLALVTPTSGIFTTGQYWYVSVFDGDANAIYAGAQQITIIDSSHIDLTGLVYASCTGAASGGMQGAILITTAANLYAVINTYNVSVYAPSTNTQTSAVDITLTNPPPNASFITMSAGSKKYILPAMNAAGGLPTSYPISIVNSGGTNAFGVYANDGTTLIQTLSAGDNVVLTLTANTTANGTFSKVYTPAVTAGAVSALTGDVTATGPGSVAATIANNAVTLAKLATQATNTVLGNATSGTAVPTALAVGSCSSASSALIWTTNTGFGCNTSITANAVPAANLTGATLASGVTASSLTSLGTVTSLTATTINAYTLGGAISGGGNQINNVVIGTTTPLAGFFTAVYATGALATGASRAILDYTVGGPGSARLVALGPDASTVPTMNFYVGSSNASIFLNYLSVGSSGTANFATNIASTSKTTGTIIVTGGLGVSGAIFTDTLSVITMAADTAQVDATVCRVAATGLLYTGTGALGICLGTSGRQFKTAITPMREGLAELMKVDFVNYNYLPGYGDSGARRQYGTTAQSVETALPDLARHDLKGSTINYDSGALLFIGLRAIQELKADNDNLRQEIETLKRRVGR